MHIEAYIKDLLFDYNQVVIPGFGAFVGTEKFAHIYEAEQKIYPPSKQISFDDQLQLDDGVLISKIEEEEQMDKDAAIEAVQHFVEELSNKLDNQKVYTIEGLGTLRKAQNEHIAFQQNKTINYFVDAYGLEPIDLPKRISLNEVTNGAENNNSATEELPLTAPNPVEEKTDMETLENNEEEEIGRLDDIKEYADSLDSRPLHEGQEILDAEELEVSYESIEEDSVDVEEASYQLNEDTENSLLENQQENVIEEEKIASGFDEYVEDSNNNYPIEAEKKVEVSENNGKTKKGFSLWLLLLPLMLLFAAGYLLFTLMGKTENPYAEKMPKAKQVTTTPDKAKENNADIQSDKTLSNRKNSDQKKSDKKEDKGLSANSTATPLKTKTEKAKDKTDSEKKSTTSTKQNAQSNNSNKKNEPTTGATNLAKGYYVIISSTKSKKEANNETQKLTKRNYPAFVLPGPNNYNRIGIYTGINKTEAEQKLSAYKSEINSAAWILKY